MKKVMVGIIGCGTIANSAHIPAYLKNEDVEIKYFCDIIPERAKAAVEKYGCGIAVEDYHRVLEDPEVEAISVCTPNRSIQLLRSTRCVRASMYSVKSLQQEPIRKRWKCRRYSMKRE